MDITHWVYVEGAALAAEFVPPADPPAAPLVFLHAGVADSRMWEGQWSALSARHPRLRYDRRGFGRTELKRAQPYSRTRDLWAVMDAAGLQRAVLVGCSQGGRLALDAALEQPGRVQALVLVAPAVGGAPATQPTPAEAALQQRAEAAIAAGDLATANEAEAQLWLDGPLAPAGRVGLFERALFREMNAIALAAPDPGPVIEAEPAWPRLETLSLPTLLLWGDLDLQGLQARCQTLAQRIRGAQHRVLAGTAHLPGMEAPARFNAALRGFLAANGLGPAG